MYLKSMFASAGLNMMSTYFWVVTTEPPGSSRRRSCVIFWQTATKITCLRSKLFLACWLFSFRNSVLHSSQCNCDGCLRIQTCHSIPQTDHLLFFIHPNFPQSPEKRRGQDYCACSGCLAWDRFRHGEEVNGNVRSLSLIQLVMYG